MARKALTLDQMKALAGPLASAKGVPLPLVLAIASAESGFAGWATRGEPQIGDASIGLMQVLVSTARAQGYTGSVGAWNDATNTGTGLYDPATNLRYGIAQIASLLKKAGGDVEAAVAGYNAGSGRMQRVTTVTRFCLAWKPTAPKTGRTLDRDCANIYTAKPGEFLNQPYVNKVMALAKSYGFVASGGVANPGAGSAPTAGAPSTSTKPGATYFVVSTAMLVAAAAIVGIVWMAQRVRHG